MSENSSDYEESDLTLILKMLKTSIRKIKEYQTEMIQLKKKNKALEKVLLEKHQYIFKLETKLKKHCIL